MPQEVVLGITCIYERQYYIVRNTKDLESSGSLTLPLSFWENLEYFLISLNSSLRSVKLE